MKNGTTDPGKLYVNISLSGNVSTDDDPECKVWWGDGKFNEKVKLKKNSTMISHKYVNVCKVFLHCTFYMTVLLFFCKEN